MTVPVLHERHLGAAKPPEGAARAATVRVTTACTGCGACLLTCPEHAMLPIPGGLVVRAERCTGCLECVEVCPADAIEETP